MTEKYRDWEILDEIPQGWVIDKMAGSPAPNTVFVTNGKSVLSGQQKRALLKVEAKRNTYTSKKETVQVEVVLTQEIEDYNFPAKTVNTLARRKFQEQLLKEIMFDLMVCEIEGWDKLEYLNELKELINSISTKA